MIYLIKFVNVVKNNIITRVMVENYYILKSASIFFTNFKVQQRTTNFIKSPKRIWPSTHVAFPSFSGPAGPTITSIFVSTASILVIIEPGRRGYLWLSCTLGNDFNYKKKSWIGSSLEAFHRVAFVNIYCKYHHGSCSKLHMSFTK